MNAPDRPPALPMSVNPVEPGALENVGGALTRLIRRVGLARLLASATVTILALLFARFSWSVPLADDVERVLYDVRALVTAPHVDQDPRITLVVYTDETLANTGKRSPLDRAMLAKALRTLDAMHPKAIGIDILLDQPQPEDPQLIAAFQSMKTPTYLGFASNATNAVFMQTWQESFLRQFLGKLKPGNVHPTSIRLQADRDNVMRSWPDQPRELPPLLANSLALGHDAYRDYHAGIAYRLPAFPDRPVFNSLPIDLFAIPAMAEALRPQIEGRYVLIGGDISDLDQFEVPATRISKETMIGLEVHATLLAQMLDGRALKLTPTWMLWIAALLVICSAKLSALLEVRPWKMALLLGAQLLLIVVLPFYLRSMGVDTQRIPAFGWLVGWALAYMAVGAVVRSVTSDQRKFAQSALGKYLPRDVANAIMRDPQKLSLSGEKREIYALFTDLEGFTKLSHAIEPEMVAFLLNRYLDTLSNIILQHGGTIDKFVGDAVVAFWGAPLARPDDAERAAKCAVALYEAGQAFRQSAPPGVPPLGCTRVGLHKGEAIVGNFGGEGRIQYTALGDSMNLAARLEGANKQLKTCALVSGPAAKAAADAVPLRPMGRVAVRGRSTPIDIYEPFVAEELGHVTRLTELMTRFDDGDATALAELKTFAKQHPGDAALANLVYRLQNVGPGGSFVLE